MLKMCTFFKNLRDGQAEFDAVVSPYLADICTAKLPPP